MTSKAQDVAAALRNLSQQDQLDVFAQVFQAPSRGDATIDVTPFRERFLTLSARDGLSAMTVAERMGWFYGPGENGHKPKGDGTRLKRRLGLLAENSGKGYWRVRRHVSYETAVALCPVLGLDYVEMDV